MITTDHPSTPHQQPQPRAGSRVELARYTLPEGERVLYGQRIDGVVRVTDHPADGHGRCYLVERELELDGHAALNAMIDDYLTMAGRLAANPMATSILAAIHRAQT